MCREKTASSVNSTFFFHEVSKNTRAIPQLEIKSGIKLTLGIYFSIMGPKIALSAKGHSLQNYFKSISNSSCLFVIE
jgi:hypothetical protein